MSSSESSELIPNHWQAAARAFLPVKTRFVSVQRMSGGFSGDDVLKVETQSAAYILRRLAASEIDEHALNKLCRWLAQLRQHGMPVAVPIRCRDSALTTFQYLGSSWQMEPCLPGVVLEGDQLSFRQLQHLMQTVAQLHVISDRLHRQDPVFDEREMEGVPASVGTRLRLLKSWTPDRLEVAFQGLQNASGKLREAIDVCLTGMIQHQAAMEQELEHCLLVSVPLHPCFRDLWQSNILFDGDHVSGIIDPHATRVDHVSTDLSRLLGSLFGDDHARRSQALELYEQTRPLSSLEHRLIRIMDRSSVLLSGMTWISRWLDHPHDPGVLKALSLRLIPIAARVRNLSANRSALPPDAGAL